jgi:hypothetical protein
LIHKRQKKQINSLNKENLILKEQLNVFKKKSSALRDRYIMDIGSVLRDSNKIDEKNKMYEETLLENKQYQEIIYELREKISDLENQVSLSAKSKLSVENVAIFHLETIKLTDIEDNYLLIIFSFLDTLDVISSAQVCKSMYTKVNILFGIDGNLSIENKSETIVPESKELIANSSKSNSKEETGKMENKIQIEELSKKLNGLITLFYKL